MAAEFLPNNLWEVRPRGPGDRSSSIFALGGLHVNPSLEATAIARAAVYFKVRFIPGRHDEREAPFERCIALVWAYREQ